MEVAILKTDGTPVRLGPEFTDLRFDVNGFLVGFLFKRDHSDKAQEYKYLQNADFKSEHRYKQGLEGYFEQSAYLQYYQSNEHAEDVMFQILIKLFKLDFSNYIAKKGDSVAVKVVDFGAPYDEYYHEKKFTFPIEEYIDGEVRKYQKTVIDNFQVIDHEVDIPLNVVGIDTYINLMNEHEGYFYSNNFGKYVNNWNIDPAEKRKIKKIATLIAYKISYIVKDIFPKIINRDRLVYLQSVANRTKLGISDLTPIEQTVFTLLWEWGYFYIPDGNPEVVYRVDFPTILSAESNYNDYFHYYGSLLNFYSDCYKIQDNLLKLSEEKRLTYLLQLLSIVSLTAIPYESIISVLKDIINGARRDGQGLSEEVQRFVVRLVVSISVTNNQNFLDFLLTGREGPVTNFEILYNHLDSARLERISYIKWFVDEQPNRKYFSFAIYELWKNSIYNFGYFPSSDPQKEGELNPNSYFVRNSTEFNHNNILVFDRINTTTNNGLPTYVAIDFESTIDGQKIIINTKKRETKYYISGQMTENVTTEFGRFHLYHPISLSGYSMNADLAIPKTATIPAFMFHFVDEYDTLADFDAGISLIIDLTTDVLLTYFTGGFNVLGDLKYLRHISQLGKAMRGLLGPTESIVVWRGLEAGSEALALTQTSLINIHTYLITREDNPDKKEILRRNQEILFGLLILTGTSSLAFRSKTSRAAGEVLALIEKLPAGQPTGITPELRQLLVFLKGEQTVTLTLFGNELKNMDVGENVTNNLFNIFDSYFNEAEKWSFWNSFKSKSILEFKQLNKAPNGQNMLNWRSIYREGMSEAGDINYVTRQKLVDDNLRYYKDLEKKAVIEGFTKTDKVRFFTDYGDLDLSIDKIKEWGLLPFESDKVLLKRNEYFWTLTNFDVNQIRMVDPVIKHGATKIRSEKLKNYFRFPENESLAIKKFVADGGKWSNGEVIENAAVGYIKNIMSAGEEYFLHVDIVYYDINRNILKSPGRIIELDGILYNRVTNNIEKIVSMKLQTSQFAKTASRDVDKLNKYMRNLPDEGVELISYIKNTPVLNKLDDVILNQIVEAKISYIDIRTGKQITTSPSQFRKLMKNSYNTGSDFIKIDPQALGTNYDDMMKSAYEAIKNNIKL